MSHKCRNDESAPTQDLGTHTHDRLEDSGNASKAKPPESLPLIWTLLISGWGVMGHLQRSFRFNWRGSAVCTREADGEFFIKAACMSVS